MTYALNDKSSLQFLLRPFLFFFLYTNKKENLLMKLPQQQKLI